MVFRYTDFTGERKQTQKRGFKTKREATAWEHEMMLRKGNKLDMTFESFYEMYSEYKRQRVKESTFETKSHIVRTKILPYFGKRKINEITVTDVIAWQYEMMAYRDEMGKPSIKNIRKRRSNFFCRSHDLCNISICCKKS